MRIRQSLAGGLVCLAFLATTARAETPTPPSRLIPTQADLVIEVKQPRQFVQTFTTLDSFKKLQQFPSVKEIFESTQYRRFYQFIAYYEKELGAQWPELLDKLAGGGMALGVKFGPNPPLALLVIQGTDAALMKRFVELAVKVIEQEINRQETKAKVETTKYEGIEVFSIGGDFHMALAGKTLFLATKDQALQGGLKLLLGKEKTSVADLPTYAAAGKLLPKDPMVRLWFNLSEVHKRPEAKEFYKTPRDPAVTILLSHYVDVFSRSPFLCASFGKQGNDYLTTIRLPAGRDGMGAEKTLRLPDNGKTGTRPVLEPKGVIYSTSFYLDFAKIWEDRVAIFGEMNAKGIEKADKDIGKVPFLGGLQLNKILPQWGPYHRIVVAAQPKLAYKKTPKTLLPAFAFVTEMRNPDGFAQIAEGIVRGAALFGGGQVGGLTLNEVKYKDCNIVSYRFNEEGKLKQDVNDIRFNFTPSLVRVGNQLVLCSTLDLCRELVDLLQAEAKAPAKLNMTTSTDRIYSAGIADILKSFEETLVTQGVLDQAIPAPQAKEQVAAFIELVRGLGSLSEAVTFEGKTARFDLRTKAK